MIIMQGAKPHSGVMETRGIGKPITFKGEEKKYTEWKAKMLAFPKVNIKSSDEWIAWAVASKDCITAEIVAKDWGQHADQVMSFASTLYSTLLSCTEEDAFRICHSVKDGNGLEAMRLIVKRYEPRTPATKRALLKAVINNPQAKKVEDIEINLMHVEEVIKKYENLARDSLPEDLQVTVIIDLCTKDLKEHLELITKEMTYKEVRDEIISYVERKRDSFGNQLKAMEVDNYEQVGHWGGGECEECYQEPMEMYSFYRSEELV